MYTPTGNLYQELKAPYDRDARADRNAPHSRRVKIKLPVGGTSISTSSLYGLWRVEPHLDDELTPCGVGTQFKITQ